MNLNNEVISWLLSANPWAKYRTLADLIEKPLDNTDVKQAKQEMLKQPLIKELINDTKNWFPESITRHNDPKISYYKLRMLADFGFTYEDVEVKNIVDEALSHFENGFFTIRQELPTKEFTKADKTSNKWYAQPCDSPLLTAIFLKMGVNNDKVNQSVQLIKEKWKDEKGWFCHFFFVESQFKKLQIGCPMAGLQALEVFAQVPELKESIYAKNAFAPIKYHYESGKSLYYFGRSKKFWTLKYPFVWYNALYLAYVLSQFNFLKDEPIVKELINWINSMQDDEGKFKSTSVFQLYKKWDFGNKKEASPWLTYLCLKILKNYDQ